MYRTKQTYQETEGFINDQPSKTVEGEYQEMKDILNQVLSGTPYEKKEVSYFPTETASQINHMFKNSLDLTDLDGLKAQANYFNKAIKQAQKAKEREILESQKTESEQQPETIE